MPLSDPLAAAIFTHLGPSGWEKCRRLLNREAFSPLYAWRPSPNGTCCLLSGNQHAYNAAHAALQLISSCKYSFGGFFVRCLCVGNTAATTWFRPYCNAKHRSLWHSISHSQCLVLMIFRGLKECCFGLENIIRNSSKISSCRVFAPHGKHGSRAFKPLRLEEDPPLDEMKQITAPCTKSLKCKHLLSAHFFLWCHTTKGYCKSMSGHLKH